MNTNALECSGCLQKITDRQFLICFYCNSTYDLMCANYTENRFYLMTEEHKSHWKCPACYCKSKRNIGDNSNTPFGKCPPGYTSDNITFRKPRPARQLSLDLSDTINTCHCTEI